MGLLPVNLIFLFPMSPRMLSQEQIEKLAPRVKVFQIICGSMIAGVLTMTLLMFVMKGEPKFNQSLGIIPLIGIAMALTCFVVSFVAPRIVQNSMVGEMSKDAADKSSEDGTMLKMFGAIQSSRIIKFALIEGALFTNVIFWYLEGSVFNLAAVGFGLLLMVFAFPTVNKCVSKLEAIQESVRH